MGEAVSKVADPVNCCGARKPDIKDGPNANPKNKTGGGGGTDAIIGGDAFGGLFGRKLQLDPGQLVISDACYKGNLDEVGLVPSCAPHAPARNSFCQGGGAPPPPPPLVSLFVRFMPPCSSCNVSLILAWHNHRRGHSGWLEDSVAFLLDLGAVFSPLTRPQDEMETPPDYTVPCCSLLGREAESNWILPFSLLR
jgi:hypothetical protein